MKLSLEADYWAGISIHKGSPEAGKGDCLTSVVSGKKTLSIHDLEKGDYYIHISTYDNKPQNTDFCLDATVWLPPANDECTDAVELTVNKDENCSNPTSGTVISATNTEKDYTCFGSADDDVWYSFKATQTQHIVSISNVEGKNKDLAYGVFTGTCGKELLKKSCSDMDTGLRLYDLVVGETYYLQVYSYTAVRGQNTSFDICINSFPEK